MCAFVSLGMVYLDRHNIYCYDGMGTYAINMFQLQMHKVCKGRGKFRRCTSYMRYTTKCCSVPWLRKWTAVVCSRSNDKYTHFDEDGGGDDGNTVYLDRQRVSCGNTGFIKGFKLQRNGGHDRVRYRYNCCRLRSGIKTDCYDTHTTFYKQQDNLYSNPNVSYLAHHKVQCRDGYFVSSFQLHRNRAHTQYRYNYTCCRSL